MTLFNRRWTLASRPPGLPASDNFRLDQTPLPTLREGEVLVQTLYLSVDPYIRGRMRNVRSYVPPFEIGDVIEGAVAGRVLESRDPAFRPGEFVSGRGGWQDYSVIAAADLRRLDPDPALLPASLGLLGMPGLTAYFALTDVGRPKPGETVLVSGAAGAVGSTAGQIAKILGCRAVGVCGSAEKARWLTTELGFDAAVNYREDTPVRRALKAACPSGINVYFDNVGGDISDAAITLINLRARIIICGQISIINREKTEMGPRNLLYLLVNRARMEGFLVRDYDDRAAEGVAQLAAWLREGKLKHRETIVEGLENAPAAFIGLFKGENIGKMLVRVST